MLSVPLTVRRRIAQILAVGIVNKGQVESEEAYQEDEDTAVQNGLPSG